MTFILYEKYWESNLTVKNQHTTINYKLHFKNENTNGSKQPQKASLAKKYSHQISDFLRLYNPGSMIIVFPLLLLKQIYYSNDKSHSYKNKASNKTELLTISIPSDSYAEWNSYLLASQKMLSSDLKRKVIHQSG